MPDLLSTEEIIQRLERARRYADMARAELETLGVSSVPGNGDIEASRKLGEALAYLQVTVYRLRVPRRDPMIAARPAAAT